MNLLLLLTIVSRWIPFSYSSLRTPAKHEVATTLHLRPRPMSRLIYATLLLLPAFALSGQADTLYGDLTADGLPEMLVTVRHRESIIDTLEGYEILKTATVCRNINGVWEPWPAARGFLMHAYEEAGMARFYASIQRGALVLIHGKSGYLSWETTHRFRWQNDQFELIGYTYSQLERCERSELFDYNLSTGKWMSKIAYWTCGDNWEPLNKTNAEERRGERNPGRAYTLSEGGYLDFGPPEQ